MASAAGPAPSPSRPARSRTWDADSSPVAYRTPARGARDAARHPAGDLEQERRLADARLAADQKQRPGHDPAAQHAIELNHSRREPTGRRLGRRGERNRLGAARPTTRPGPGGRARRHDRLDEGVPGRARAALAFPAREVSAAGLADEAALRPGQRLPYETSTGVFCVCCSAAWITMPSSALASTSIVVPGS